MDLNLVVPLPLVLLLIVVAYVSRDRFPTRANVGVELFWKNVSAHHGWKYEPAGRVKLVIPPIGTMRMHIKARNIVRGQAHGWPFEAFAPAGWSFSRQVVGSMASAPNGSFAGILTVALPAHVPASLRIVARRPSSRERRVQMPWDPDPNFESEAFNDRYIVWSELPPKSLYDVITPRAMEWLLWAPEGFEIQFYGRSAFVVTTDAPTPAWIDVTSQVVTAVVGAVPSYVWEEFKALEAPFPSGADEDGSVVLFRPFRTKPRL